MTWTLDAVTNLVANVVVIGLFAIFVYKSVAE